MKNLAGLMKQASQMQAKMADMQARIEAASVDGQAGAGMVRLTLSGKGDLRALQIDPKLLNPAEMEILTDLIIAAHADAKRRVDELARTEMAQVTGGLDLPAGLKLPF